MLLLVENKNKMISAYLHLSLSIILFLSFCADKDHRPPNGLTCFLDVIFVYVLKVTVMTFTRYSLISIKDLQAARKKLNLEKINIFFMNLISIV
jgi:hypothetical protein